MRMLQIFWRYLICSVEVSRMRDKMNVAAVEYAALVPVLTTTVCRLLALRDSKLI